MSQIDLSKDPFPVPDDIKEVRGATVLHIVDKKRKINLGHIAIYPHMGAQDLEDALMAILPGMNTEPEEATTD